MDNETLIKLAVNGDGEAQNKIVTDNTYLVWSIVKRFKNRGYDAEELFQIGCIGIIKAIKNFDVSFNVKFSTYAVPMIMGEIKRFLRDDGIIHISRRLKEISMNAMKVKERIEKTYNREAKISELAQECNVSEYEICEALNACCTPESLYAKAVSFGDGEVTIMDKLKDKRDDYESVLNNMTIKSAFERLGEREKKIVYLRYCKSKTQCETAKIIGVSQVQISRIEKNALIKMRNFIGPCI